MTAGGVIFVVKHHIDICNLPLINATASLHLVAKPRNRMAPSADPLELPRRPRALSCRGHRGWGTQRHSLREPFHFQALLSTDRQSPVLLLNVYFLLLLTRHWGAPQAHAGSTSSRQCTSVEQIKPSHNKNNPNPPISSRSTSLIDAVLDLRRTAQVSY